MLYINICLTSVNCLHLPTQQPLVVCIYIYIYPRCSFVLIMFVLWFYARQCKDIIIYEKMII